MSNSITPDNNPSKVKLDTQTSVQTDKKQDAPKDMQGFLQLIADGLIEKGATKDEAKQFVEHPIVQKTTEKYVQSLAKNNANAKTGLGAGPLAGLNLMARIMLVFSFTQTRLNDKLAELNKEQDAINKLLPEIAKIIEEIKARMDGGKKPVMIPPDLQQYIVKHGPNSYTNSAGKVVTGNLTGALGMDGGLELSKANEDAMSDAFSGMQTALTTGNTTKVKLQSATQKNLNFTKEMGHLITAFYGMLKENARKL